MTANWKTAGENHRWCTLKELYNSNSMSDPPGPNLGLWRRNSSVLQTELWLCLAQTGQMQLTPLYSLPLSVEHRTSPTGQGVKQFLAQPCWLATLWLDRKLKSDPQVGTRPYAAQHRCLQALPTPVSSLLVSPVFFIYLPANIGAKFASCEGWNENKWI